jgi:hypothetical protein
MKGGFPSIEPVPVVPEPAPADPALPEPPLAVEPLPLPAPPLELFEPVPPAELLLALQAATRPPSASDSETNEKTILRPTIMGFV